MMVNNDLINLIENFNPKCIKLHDDLSLYHDLNIFGDDAEELLTMYSEIFNVSLNKMVFDSYFPSEGDDLIPSIIRFLIGKKRRVYKRLTIGDMVEGIVRKELK